MPTREYTDLVSVVTETIEQMLPMIMPDPGHGADAPAGFRHGSTPACLFDFEKIVWHYPDAPARLIEE